ncbi:hypothetical protein GW17_00036964 [Ensete ventricosum]|nr:hypothetical protein GW17_00036964 [Ensete ventricosum]
MSHSEERASRFGIQRKGQPLCARGTIRTSKRRRMHSVQRLGWLSLSYSSTLATKLDGAQGKAGRLAKDETMQSGRCCGAKDEGSFEAHASYLRDAFDGVTKAIQLAEVKLGSRDLSMGQEDVEAGMIGAAGELDCFSAHIRLREPASQRTKPSGRKGQGSDDESSGAQLLKSKASIRKEVDSEEHHSAAEVDLPIAKEGMQMQVNG